MVVCACASVSGHKRSPTGRNVFWQMVIPILCLFSAEFVGAALVAARQNAGARGAFGLHLVGVQQNRHRPVVLASTPAYPRRTPTGLRPAGTPVPFYLPGRSESARHRGFGSAKTLGRRGRGGEFGPTSGRCQQNRHRPVVLRIHLHIRPERPTGLPPRGDPGSLFICRGGVNPPRHRGFGSAKTLGRAGGAGASSALHLVGVQQNRHRSVVLRIHLHVRAEHPTGLPPRGDPGSPFYLPGE